MHVKYCRVGALMMIKGMFKRHYYYYVGMHVSPISMYLNLVQFVCRCIDSHGTKLPEMRVQRTRQLSPPQMTTTTVLVVIGRYTYVGTF